jgi:hypothetical protein
MGVKAMVEDAVQREVETLLESYGTEHWDDRDVTYDNLIWGTSGIEVPIKRILYQVELTMQEAVSNFMPEVAEVVADELERTLEAHEIQSRLKRTLYDQEYSFNLPSSPGVDLTLEAAYEQVVDRVGSQFRQICRQATMYELVRPERSIHQRVRNGEEALILPDDDQLLDVVLYGPERARRKQASQARAIVESQSQSHEEASPDVTEEASADDFIINILDSGPVDQAVEIKLSGEIEDTGYGDSEISYADKLDNIALKTNKVFSEIIEDLFSDDELLPRLRRLFWLEATKSERDYNNYLVKPIIKQHDRKLSDPKLREAMEIDLESVSDVEELMHVWQGLHNLETLLTM